MVVDQLRVPLEAAGHLVRACSVDDAPTCPIGYDLVIIGSSIHQGHHHRGVTRWVKGNVEFLGRISSAFFQVSLSAAGGAGGADEAQRYVDDLVKATRWHPDVYWDYDYTDHRGVEQFAQDIGTMLDRVPHVASA
ncbi:MAG: hypothetical protein LH645_01585 [Actinomycetia bacterium]|nr:hypothetical protein [Actinomycetes bacterium]